ncbi:L-fucose:H+ symporter permease [Aliiglaciecola lipolytica]|uniref:MFS transporter, FHS family, L-fucose permease n=1 Tax=Aliiglaciecola lipolytica E3 TaxID=1127673 RepID=K6WXD0_9ALTE|nr:L-fucose:H+ symporter permease [Aliiglaciecola lipolytica]GAC13114.1 MFS transporter, FHS family, L-fucose permease [Aliiglaciecola lipolytica E3]
MQTEANVIQDDPVSAIPVNTTNSAPLIGRGLLLPFILITACFALWGAANNMTDLLVPAFQKVLGMTQLQSSFIQSAFYGAYFVMALPAAILIQKYSYKTGVMTGLSIYAIGALLCYPASQAMSFELFLIAFYVFASGCAVLETVAAPYILSMGSSETATQRINLAQAFNPVGVLMGVYLGKEVILKGLNTATDEQRASMSASELLGIQTQELGNVVSAYQVVALVAILLAVVVFIAKLPVAKSSDNFGNLKDSFNRLKKNTTWKFAVVTQFFYVGCQIGVWTYAIKYIMDNHPEVTTAAQAGEYVFWGLCVYTVFRFVCTGLMSYVRPAKLLCVMAMLAITMVLIAVLVGGTIGTLALLTCFSCMSLMFPTIYGLGLSDVGEDRKLGGSFIIMAILGGAVLVPLQGWVIDITESVNISYLIPLSCFSVVFVFAWLTNKKLES